MFKKRNVASKLWLKYTDRPAYKTYKWELQNYQNIQFNELALTSGRLNNLENIRRLGASTGYLNLMHSGNAGDIIYALPTIKRIHELTGLSMNLYLHLGKPSDLRLYNSHPVGNVMLNQVMADMLIPLINTQNYVNSCDVLNGKQIHIDLDFFRAGLLPMQGNIARWVSYIVGVNPQLYQPWLHVKANQAYANCIVIARSGRYQNTSIDYSFLKHYRNLVFLGIESEYNDIKRYLPAIEWVPVNNFLQMAEIIAGCKFFIGNQSFPFALAEGLKVPRVLELSLEIINVVPEGENAYDFLFQDHFESLVKMSLDNA
jgi:hypothetical protein